MGATLRKYYGTQNLDPYHQEPDSELSEPQKHLCGASEDPRKFYFE